MALSNWDTLAVDQSGESTNGVFTSTLGVGVEIYKNWLYLSDPKVWEEEGGYAHPTFMEFWHGELRYKDIEIYAERGPQNGIFCLVKEQIYDTKNDNIMFGIGCYGFADSEWVGVRQESIDFFIDMLSIIEDKSCTIFGIKRIFKRIDFSKALRFNQGDAFFAEKLGFSTPATKIGQAENTIFSKAIDSMKKEK